MFERILAPLDGSKDAESALPFVDSLAQRLGSQVVPLGVVTQKERVEEGHDGATMELSLAICW